MLSNDSIGYLGKAPTNHDWQGGEPIEVRDTSNVCNPAPDMLGSLSENIDTCRSYRNPKIDGLGHRWSFVKNSRPLART